MLKPTRINTIFFRLGTARMSSSASSDDRFFPNVFPRDIGDNKDKIMDSDHKKVKKSKKE